MKKAITFLILIFAFIGSGKIHALNDGDDFTVGKINYTVISETDKTCKTKSGYVQNGNIIAGNSFSFDNLILSETVTYDEIDYTLIEIGDYSFYNRTIYSSINIPNSVVRIGDYSFQRSSIRGDIILGNSVKYIGRYAFQSIYIPDTYNPKEGLKIPDSVVTIGDFAFYDIDIVGELKLSESLESIGDYAFSYNGFTGDLKIPDSVVTIGANAFYNCSKFKGNLIIGNSVQSIEYEAFSGCSGFTGDLKIPDSVQIIEDVAFYNCTGFTGELKLSTSLLSIGESVFRNCSGFTGELKIPDSVELIDCDAFHGCAGFTSLVIGNSIQKIAISAFSDCTGFKGDLKISDSIITLGYGAFYNCTGFTALVIGSSVQTIGQYAFKGCIGFKGDLVIGNSVQTIYDSAFEGCTGFDGDLIIGNSVLSIEKKAFYGCSGFRGELIVGNSVQSIGSSAFEGCNNFNKVISKNTVPPDIYKNSFDGLYHLYLYVPEQSIISYKRDWWWSEFQFIEGFTEAISPEEITLSIDDLTLLAGQTYQLKAEIKPEDVTDKTITWSSDDSTIAEVSEDGTVKAIAKGTAQITAKCGEVEATCNVTILDSSDVTYTPGEGTTEGDESKTPQENTENGASLMGSDITLRVGQTGGITLGLPETLTSIPALQWTLRDNGDEIVNLNVGDDTWSASFTGLKPGETTYTVTDKVTAETLANGNIKVIAKVPESISITSISLEGNSGKTELKATEWLNLTAKVLPEDAEFKKIIWSVEQDGLMDIVIPENSDATEVTVKIRENVKPDNVVIKAYVDGLPEVSASYTVNISDLVLGDANDDKGVTVTDVMVIAAKILNQNTNLDSNPVESFCFINADVNPNKKIEVDDQDATLLIARGLPYNTQSLTRSTEGYFGYLSWSIDGDNVIGLRFDNPSQFINLQADIVIPEGFEVRKVEEGTQLDGHIMGYNMINENLLRILVYSLERTAFKIDQGNLVNIYLQGKGDIEDLAFGDIISNDKSSLRYDLKARYTPSTTGIRDIDSEAISVVGAQGCIRIFNAEGKIIMISNSKGLIIHKAFIDSAYEEIKLNPGIYLVSIGTLNKKILIKH